MFTGAVKNGTPKTFMGIQYESWFIGFGKKLYLVIIDQNKNKSVFFNQVNIKLPTVGTIDPRTVHRNDFCYRCYISGPYFFFVS